MGQAHRLIAAVRLRPAHLEDARAIAAIYAPYVNERAVSFETEAPDAMEIARRMTKAGDRYPWLTVEADDGSVAGYAYASAFRSRRAYRFSVETTVYVDDRWQKQGIGARLYTALLERLTAQRFTQAIAAIALPNLASIALHERLGFRHTGTYERVGWKLGEWHDVGIWQRTLAAADAPASEPLRLSELLAPQP